MIGKKLMDRILLSRAAKTAVMSFLVLSSIQPSFAGFLGAARMQSTGPCAYSLQLQNSVEERRRYLVKLEELTGTAVASTSVEQMYGNIKLASFGSGDTSSADILGFEIKSIDMDNGNVDFFSTACISCHDGASAVAIGANQRNDPTGNRYRKSPASDHPIGMDYQSYLAANGGKYKPLLGNTRMVLMAGKVGCITCHDPLNPERGHLVMSDRRSSLCLTCHNK